MSRWLRVLVALLLAAACGAALAQSWPARPVRIVAPFPPGGPIDVLARTVAEKLQARSAQPVIVENRPGAAGNIGIELVARAASDGYTLLFVPQGNITINATLMKMPFSWDRDFVPVTLVATAPNMIAVHPSLAAKTVQEFIAHARANPGKVTYGSPGIGSSLHLAGELLKRSAVIDIVHVPYKGTTQAMQDLMGGQITLMFGSVPTLMPQVRAGKLRALAVTTAKRSPAAPDLPTVEEAGIRDFDVASWYGAMAPAGTPAELVRRIQSEIAAIVNLPEVRAALAAQGLYPVANTPAEFAAQIKSETAHWARIIREANIRAE
ncbi:MAG: tripartite tricarboxylate transporter substrate binding protein [Betaproteobacteria bacterium]|nr:tripartite tricarboxylate transporter substrate binding protein [Betaproteobacteria bacterium]